MGVGRLAPFLVFDRKLQKLIFRILESGWSQITIKIKHRQTQENVVIISSVACQACIHQSIVASTIQLQQYDAQNSSAKDTDSHPSLSGLQCRLTVWSPRAQA